MHYQHSHYQFENAFNHNIIRLKEKRYIKSMYDIKFCFSVTQRLSLHATMEPVSPLITDAMKSQTVLMEVTKIAARASSLITQATESNIPL